LSVPVLGKPLSILKIPFDLSRTVTNRFVLTAIMPPVVLATTCKGFSNGALASQYLPLVFVGVLVCGQINSRKMPAFGHNWSWFLRGEMWPKK